MIPQADSRWAGERAVGPPESINAQGCGPRETPCGTTSGFGTQEVSESSGGCMNRSRHASRGMVTAEMAVSLITATMAVIAGVWAVSLVIVHDACRVTASQIAQQRARGDLKSAEQAQRKAPEGARITTASRDGWVRVTVSTDRSLGKIGPVHLQASAAAPQEPGELK